MKIGIIVDGESEYFALPPLLEKIAEQAGQEFLRPVRAPIHPKSPPGTIARACKAQVNQLSARGVGLIVVLVDLEDREECPSILADAIRVQLSKMCGVRVEVVIKNSTFENWIVADVAALRTQTGRFRISRTVEQAIVPDKADRCNALSVLKRASQGGSYEKKTDAQNTLRLADPLQMASNSRSFRRFLRCVGHPAYVSQSKSPQSSRPARRRRRS